MMNYRTNYATDEPVDFLAKGGPLRATERYVEASYESRQILAIPEPEAPIWEEWRSGVSQNMATAALKEAQSA